MCPACGAHCVQYPFISGGVRPPPEEVFRAPLQCGPDEHGHGCGWRIDAAA